MGVCFRARYAKTKKKSVINHRPSRTEPNKYNTYIAWPTKIKRPETTDRNERRANEIRARVFCKCVSLRFRRSESTVDLPSKNRSVRSPSKMNKYMNGRENQNFHGFCLCRFGIESEPPPRHSVQCAIVCGPPLFIRDSVQRQESWLKPPKSTYRKPIILPTNIAGSDGGGRNVLVRTEDAKRMLWLCARATTYLIFIPILFSHQTNSRKHNIYSSWHSQG